MPAKIIAFLATLTIILGTGVQIATASFAPGALTTCLARYNVVYADSWDDLGFVSLAGVPLVLNSGATKADRIPYAHMPPVGWWPPYLGRLIFGKSFVALRFFGALFSMATVVLIGWIIARQSGWYAGGFAMISVVAMPAFQFYAGLPGVESIALLMAVLFYLAWESADRKFRAVNAGIFMIGAFTAWSFFFVIPSLLMVSIIESRGRTERRHVLRLISWGLFSVFAVALYLAIAVGDARYVLSDIARTFLNATTDGVRGEPTEIGARAEFITSLWPMVRMNLGGGVSAVVLCWLIMILFWRPLRADPLTRMCLFLLIIGGFNVVVFNGRSSTHGYYYFLLAVGCGATVSTFAIQLMRILGATRNYSRVPLIICVSLPIIAHVANFADMITMKIAMERDGISKVAAVIDSATRTDTAILCYHSQVVDAMLVSKRRWIAPLDDAGWLESVLKRMDEGLEPYSRLVVIVENGLLEHTPSVAVAILNASSIGRDASIIQLADGIAYVITSQR